MSAGVVFVNPRSGRGDLDAEALRPYFPDARVDEVAADGLADAVQAALKAGAGFVGISGGDGSMRCAASVLAGTGVPLLAIPGGTRNHFAREVGIETAEDAAAALSSGSVVEVDVGDCNGHRFVNNAGIGFYAALVRERTRHERHLPRATADVAAAWAQARHGHRFPVSVGGLRYRAWLVFVGNGCYGDKVTNLGVRRALDEQTLDVRVLRADAPLARTRAVVALLLGRLGRSPLLVQRLADAVEVELPGRASADVALDGEVVRVPTPLRFTVLPGALRVLVPQPPAP